MKRKLPVTSERLAHHASDDLFTALKGSCNAMRESLTILEEARDQAQSVHLRDDRTIALDIINKIHSSHSFILDHYATLWRACAHTDDNAGADRIRRQHVALESIEHIERCRKAMDDAQRRWQLHTKEEIEGLGAAATAGVASMKSGRSSSPIVKRRKVEREAPPKLALSSPDKTAQTESPPASPPASASAAAASAVKETLNLKSVVEYEDVAAVVDARLELKKAEKERRKREKEKGQMERKRKRASSASNGAVELQGDARPSHSATEIGTRMGTATNMPHRKKLKVDTLAQEPGPGDDAAATVSPASHATNSSKRKSKRTSIESAGSKNPVLDEEKNKKNTKKKRVKTTHP